jgi:hypothetical protein
MISQMDNDFEGDAETYNDTIAERTQAYVWLLDSVARISVKDVVHPNVLAEGLMMLAAVRESIATKDKADLKAIRGGK